MFGKKVFAILLALILLAIIPSAALAQGCCRNYSEYAAWCRSNGGTPSGNPPRCAAPTGSGTATSQDGYAQLGEALGQLIGTLFVQALEQLFGGNSAQQAEIAQRMRDMELRSQEEIRLKIEAEARRRDEMFRRLNAELKLAGLPGLYLKGIDSAQELRLKGLANRAGELKLKLGDDAAKGYGIPGLPGIYTGGPRTTVANSGPAGQKTDTPLALKLGDEKTNPPPINGNSSDGVNSGSGTNGIPGLPGIYLNGTQQTPAGIPGLPGIYLNGPVQPSVGVQQAKQLALSAEKLTGSERELAETTALKAAAADPSLTGSSDQSVLAFKQANEQYEQALNVQNQTSEAFNEAEKRQGAVREVLKVAETQFQKEKAAGMDLTIVERRQKAIDGMLANAKADEYAWQAAKELFDGATADVTLKRGATVRVLREISAAAPSTPALTLPAAIPDTGPELKDELRDSPVKSITPEECIEIRKQLVRDQAAMSRQQKSIEQGQGELAEWTNKNTEAQKAALKRAFEFLISSLTSKLGEFNEQKLAKLESEFKKRAPMGETWRRKIEKIQEFHAAEARFKAAIDGIAIGGFIKTATDFWDEIKKWAAKNGKDADILDAIVAEWENDPEIRKIMTESGISTFASGLGLSKTLAPWGTIIDFGQFLVGYGYDATDWVLSRNRIVEQIENRDGDLKAVEALKKQIERTVTNLQPCKDQ